MSDPKLNAQCAIRKAIRLAGGEPLAPHRQDEIDRWRAFTADVRQGMAVSELAIKYCIALSTASCYASRARAGWINTRVRGSHSQTKQRGRGSGLDQMTVLFRQGKRIDEVVRILGLQGFKRKTIRGHLNTVRKLVLERDDLLK